MSLLVTGDIHLSDNERDAYRFELIERVPDLIKEHGATHFVILGDLTTKKDSHGHRLVNRVVELLARIAETADVIVDCGNHDYVDPQMPFFRFLRKLSGVSFIHEPAELELIGQRFLFLPHTADYKRDWAGIDFAGYPIIFAHNTFAGARADNGDILDGIPADIFPESCQVLTGDVHVAQRVGKVVRCVGAPYLINFGDTYAPRMMLVDESLNVSSIPMRGRQKRLIEAPCPKPIQGKPMHVFEHDGEPFAGSWGTLTPQPGDIIKLKVRLDDDVNAEAQWPALKADWKAWAESCGFIVNQIVPDIERRTAGSSQRTKPRSMDDDAILSAYGKAQKLDSATLATGRRLTRKV